MCVYIVTLILLIYEEDEVMLFLKSRLTNISNHIPKQHYSLHRIFIYIVRDITFYPGQPNPTT